MVVHDPVALREALYLLGAAGALGGLWIQARWRPFPFAARQTWAALATGIAGIGGGLALMHDLGAPWAAVIGFGIVVTATVWGTQEERAARRERAAKSARVAALALIERTRVVCNGILEFVGQRDALHPGARLGKPTDVDPTFSASSSPEYRRIQEECLRYTAQTQTVFNTTFAIEARACYSEFRDNYELTDNDLDIDLSFPMNTNVMTWIASRLGALASQLEKKIQYADPATFATKADHKARLRPRAWRLRDNIEALIVNLKVPLRDHKISAHKAEGFPELEEILRPEREKLDALKRDALHGFHEIWYNDLRHVLVEFEEQFRISGAAVRALAKDGNPEFNDIQIIANRFTDMIASLDK